MEALYASPPAVTTPLVRARKKERFASISLALVVGFVLVLVARTAVLVHDALPSNRDQLVNLVLSVAGFVLALVMVMLMRQQLQITVHQIEQAEASQVQMRKLAQALTRALPRMREQRLAARRRGARPTLQKSRALVKA